jgi:acetyltransferase-like isoleucine patch superfamily enzyme
MASPLHRRILSTTAGWAWERLGQAAAIRSDTRAAGRFAAFGEGAAITWPPSTIFGEHRIEIGDGTVVGPLASLSVGMPAFADDPGPPALIVGRRCLLGRGIGIVAHERIVIEDDVFTGHYVYITDQNHGYEDLDTPIGTQLWRNAPVRIGAGSWLGHGSVVLPGSDIGRHVVVAAGAVVSGTVPDNSVVGGIPARVLRHHVDGEGWMRGTSP